MVRAAARPAWVEGKQLTQGPHLTWSYKGCTCCGRVVPDSRSDQLGSCELCRVPRVLLDGPPATWFEIVVEEDAKGRLKKPRSRWHLEWENRPYDSLCEHEKAWLEANALKSKGWETRRAKAVPLP